jgi:hypothetical protein
MCRAGCSSLPLFTRGAEALRKMKRRKRQDFALAAEPAARASCSALRARV